MQFDIEFPTCREGVFVPSNFASAEQVVDTVVFAEKLGYGAVWGTDFVAPTPCYAIPDKAPANWYEPIVTLAYAAARTKRIKLGTGVLLGIYREPVILAKQVATLDQLSNGRVLLGLGLGMCRDEFDAVSPRRSKAHRGTLLDELIESLVMLLEHKQVNASYAGKHIEFRDVNLNPKPVQKPLPLYVPVKVADAFDRVARFGLGVMVQAALIKQRLDGLTPILEKQSMSCCGAASFVEWLEASGRRQVLVAGIEAHACVNQTVHDLLARGYEVHLARDATSSRRATFVGPAWERMMRAGALPTSVEQSLLELVRTAASPHFKELQRLLKEL